MIAPESTCGSSLVLSPRASRTALLGVLLLISTGACVPGSPAISITSPADNTLIATRTLNMTGTASCSDDHWVDSTRADFDSGICENLEVGESGSLALAYRLYDDFDDSSLDASRWTTGDQNGISSLENGGRLLQSGTGTADGYWDSIASLISMAGVNRAFADLKEVTASSYFASTIDLKQDIDNAVAVGVRRDPATGSTPRIIGTTIRAGVSGGMDFFGNAGNGPHHFGIVYSGGEAHIYADGALLKTYIIPLNSPRIWFDTSVRDSGLSVSAGWDNVFTDLFSNGTYLSRVFDTGAAGPVLTGIDWNAVEPAATRMSVSVRSSANRNMSSPTDWAVVTDGQRSGFPAIGRYIQYRAAMTSLDGVTTPVLSDLSIDYHVSLDEVDVSIDGQQSWAGVSGADPWRAALDLPEGDTVVWARAADRAGKIALACLTVSVDTTPPAGGVLINRGDEYTADRNVTLDFNATDRYGVASMEVGDQPDLAGAEWRDFAPSLPWRLPPGDGNKTVFVRFRDRNGWESALANDSILLDSTLLTGSVLINEGAESTWNRSVRLALGVTDPSNVREMLIGDGPDLGSAGWQPYADSIAWNLPDVLGQRTVYARFRDARGRSSSTVNDSIFLVPRPLPVVEILTPAENSTVHGNLVVTGTARHPGPGMTVVRVEVRLDEGPWMTAENVSEWSCSIDSARLGNGRHLLEARALDDGGWFGEARREFFFKKPVESLSTDALPCALVLLLAVIVAAGLEYYTVSKGKKMEK